MRITGYGCEAEWDGARLIARGTNKMMHFALAGQGHKGDVVIPAEEIANVSLKAPGGLTNGNLTVTTTGGHKYILNYQKKHAADFEALKAELPQASDLTPDGEAGLRPDIEAAKAKMRVKFGAGARDQAPGGYLWVGETVERMTAGQYGKGQGLVVLTDGRLMFVQDGIMPKTSEDFPLDKMSSVSWKSGMVMGRW